MVWLGWLAAVWPILLPLDGVIADQDWIRELAKFTSARNTVLEHGQVPLRTLQLGGGYPLASHPLDGSHHPLFLLVLLIGAPLSMKLGASLGILLAVYGGWYLGRRALELQPLAALWVGVTFGLSGWFSTQLRSGNWPEVYMLGLPLLLGLMVDVERKRRSLLPAAALALVMGLQSAYRMPLVVLWCLLFQSVLCLAGSGAAPLRRLGRLLGHYAGLTVLVVLVGLPRWVLAIEALRDNLRTIPVYPPEESQGLLTQVVQHGLVDLREPSHLAPELLWSAFVGPLGLGLGLAGLLLALRRPGPEQRDLRPAAAAALFLGLGASWLTAAHHAPVDLWRPLSSAPGFAAMFQPAKYFPLACCLSLAVGGGLAIHRGEEGLGSPRRSSLLQRSILAVLVLQVGLLGWHGNHQHARAFGPAPEVELPHEEGPYGFAGELRITHEVLGWYPDSFIFQAAEVVARGGAIAPWIDPLELAGSEASPRILLDGLGRSRQAPHYPGEAWLRHRSGGIQVLEATPAVVRLRVEASRPDIIVLNQRYSPHLTSDTGEVLGFEGRAAIPVAPGTSDVVVRYVNRNYQGSIPVGLLSLLALLLWDRRQRNARRTEPAT